MAAEVAPEPLTITRHHSTKELLKFDVTAAGEPFTTYQVGAALLDADPASWAAPTVIGDRSGYLLDPTAAGYDEGDTLAVYAKINDGAEAVIRHVYTVILV